MKYCLKCLGLSISIDQLTLTSVSTDISKKKLRLLIPISRPSSINPKKIRSNLSTIRRRRSFCRSAERKLRNRWITKNESLMIFYSSYPNFLQAINDFPGQSFQLYFTRAKRVVIDLKVSQEFHRSNSILQKQFRPSLSNQKVKTSFMYTAKTTQKNVPQTNPNSKYSTLNAPRSLYSISDVNKLYRREEIYKKKLKAIVETNSMLESKIKNYEASIENERSTIIFQLNELSKTMNNKTSTYIEERLDKDKFRNNERAHETIQEMMAKFEEVEKQTKTTKRVYQSLNCIYQHYSDYSEEIEKLVRVTEQSNQEYEDSMRKMLTEKENQTISKRSANEDIFDQTQINTKRIDDFETGKAELMLEELHLKQRVEELQQEQRAAQHEVDKFKDWAGIVIDKNHRKVFCKQNKQKELELKRLESHNQSLEGYLKELQSQEEALKKSQSRARSNSANGKKLKRKQLAVHKD